MTIEELGIALRKEREKRGLAVEDVAGHLKIGARLLRSLEEGDATSLPHPAYAKGFIRSYSAYLGFATDEVSEVLAALNSSQDPATPSSIYTPDEILAPRRSWGKCIVVLLLIALPVGGLYLAWQYGALEFLSRQTRRLAQPSPPLQSVEPGEAGAKDTVNGSTSRNQSSERNRQPAVGRDSGASGAAITAPGQQSQQVSGAGQQNNQATPQTTNQARTQVTNQENTAASASTAAAGVRNQGLTDDGAAASSGLNKVIITATEECWVHSNADNSDTRQFSLRRGDTFALPFVKSLELRLGNAGGVRLRYNGEELPVPGKSGQVKTVTFPPAR